MTLRALRSEHYSMMTPAFPSKSFTKLIKILILAARHDRNVVQNWPLIPSTLLRITRHPSSSSVISTLTNSPYLNMVLTSLVCNVSVDPATFTTRVALHCGPYATTRAKCVSLLDSGSPQTFIKESMWTHMKKTGAASDVCEVTTQPRVWGWFR